MYVCMYVCMYACMYACMHIRRAHINICMQIHARTPTPGRETLTRNDRPAAGSEPPRRGRWVDKIRLPNQEVASQPLGSYIYSTDPYGRAHKNRHTRQEKWQSNAIFCACSHGPSQRRSRNTTLNPRDELRPHASPSTRRRTLTELNPECERRHRTLTHAQRAS